MVAVVGACDREVPNSGGWLMSDGLTRSVVVLLVSTELHMTYCLVQSQNLT